MTIADAYVEPLIVEPTSPSDALAHVTGIRKTPGVPRYRAMARVVDIAGNPLSGGDLNPDLNADSEGSVTWDSAQPAPGALRLGIRATRQLQWGNAIVAVYQAIQSEGYNRQTGLDPASWIRFPINHFVLTSPGFDDLDSPAVRQVTGYDKNYLLQNQPNDSFAFAPASLYKDAVQAVFLAAGLITAALSEVCDYPADWAAKKLPSTGAGDPKNQPSNFPMDGNTRYLDVINAMLKASGCRQIYTKPNGRWVIEPTPVVAQQPLRWVWPGNRAQSVTDDDLKVKAVLLHGTGYQGDVWNVPNQWVFIQQGLSFTPVEGSGQYTVNNLNTPPSDQNTVGRIVRSVQFLDASGQPDLVVQGNAIVAEQLSQAEQVKITSTAWPIAGHFDVFTFLHSALPGAYSRRLQAQQWNLDLWGRQPMAWTAWAVNEL